MGFETILFEPAGGVAFVRLNRPRALNALSPEMIEELGRALDLVQADAAARVVVLSGTGRAFCAGADLGFALDALERGETAPLDGFLDRVGAFFVRLTRFPKPVVAALNGLTLAGGLELAMCADLILAAESVKIGDAHANYGLLPGGGGTVRLPRKIGVARAKWLLYTGELLPAADLLAAGLVNRVVPDAALEHEARALAATIAAKSPLGLRRMKALVADGLEQPDETGLRLERLAISAHLHSEDMREGLRAFREKRAPRFRGR